MSRLRARVLVVLALLAATPFAGAHISGYSQNQSLPLGPYAAYLELTPADPFANNSLSFSALLTDNATGNYVTDLKASMVLRGPENWTRTVQLQPDGRGYLVGAVILGGPGSYSTTFVLHGADGQDYQSVTGLTVYPDLAVRLASADPNQDVITGERTTIAIETDDPVDGRRVNAVSDLSLSIEHWSIDHATLFDTRVVDMQKGNGPGLWTYSYAFPETGMYHLRFASRSGGFNYSDVPILHLTASPAPSGSGEGVKKTPGPAVLLVIGGLAAVALAAGRRERRR